MGRDKLKEEKFYRWHWLDDERWGIVCWCVPCGGLQFCVGDIGAHFLFHHTLPPAVSLYKVTVLFNIAV